LLKAAQAWAFYNGRGYVVPDDVVQMAPHVLSHRIMLRQEAAVKKIKVEDVIKEAVSCAVAWINSAK
jgi:MoxR-like ATPase